MKITVHKQVYWSAGGRTMEGKVKQILSDHAVVHAEGSDYIVQKSALTIKPIARTASLTTIEDGIVKTSQVMPAKEIRIPAPLRKKASELLWSLCSNKYYNGVPIAQISEGLRSLGLEMESNFMITGADGRDTFELKINGQPTSSMLALQWHKMESGRYEINAYLS